MSEKTMISLNLSSGELELLNSLSQKRDLSKSAVVRQALRVLAALEERLERGEKLYFEAADKEKAEILLL